MYDLSRLKKWLLGLVFLLLAVVLWLVLSPAPEGVPVLEYHEVAESVDDDAYAYNVPPEDSDSSSTISSSRVTRPSRCSTS